ncbi:hypothetical protein F5H01DRAFT_359176 [Linnemannia elongata]|nr:hypothetical protein F5H01DRAFT_359176 [Linnemannia elongata]
MEITAYLIPVTATTAICLYIVDYSLWWAFAVPAAALVTWLLYEIYQGKKLVPSLVMLVLDIFAYFCGVSLWWVLGIPVGFLVLGFLYLCICSRHQRDKNERYRRGSVHTYSVPSYRGRTVDERTSLLPSYSRLPTGSPSRNASSQSSFISRSSLNSTPSVSRTAPDTLYRVIVDPGLLRYSTPTVAVDPRLLRYTLPTIPSPVAFDTRRKLPSNLTSASLMAAAERQLVLVQPSRNSTQLARNIPPPIPAPVARQEIDGSFLHEAVEATVDDRYPYDQQIPTKRNPRSKTGLVKGYFRCYNCKPKKYQPKGPRTWASNAICVELWMSSSGHRYRTRLHSQMCANCNTVVEPEVSKDDYVTMVVKSLDRWTGQTSVVKPRQKYFKTGPHRTDKCNACLTGICPLKPAE